MGQREWRKLRRWQCRWPGKKQGRWWKRALSKARRRFTKGTSQKEPTHYETMCNMKTW